MAATKKQEKKFQQFNVMLPESAHNAISLIKTHYNTTYKKLLLRWIKEEFEMLLKKGAFKDLGLEF